jgi:triacylglycerol lipase
VNAHKRITKLTGRRDVGSGVIMAILVVMLQITGYTNSIAGDEMARADHCVVLLHGLARSARSMDKMDQALSLAGYRVINVNYPSREHPIEILAPLAIEEGMSRCEHGSTVDFVTHSLGGILVRYYFHNNSSQMVGRVVMLAPPNQGSEAVDAMRNLPGFEWINGPAGSQLGKGKDSIPLMLGTPEFEFAVIAGNRTIDPITSSVLTNPDDGKISVADSILSGMSDFRVVAVSHAYIMKNDDVIELVQRYLAHGSFSVSVD